MKKYIIILIGSLFFAGCNDDLLEKYPINTLNPSIFWETEKDAIAAVNNLYTHLPDQRNWIYSEMMTDHAIGSSGDNGRNNVLEGTTDSNTGTFKTFWSDYYKRIAAANYFLENIDNVKYISDDLRARMIGEAKFIRAFTYLSLTMDFGDVPLVTKTLTVSEGASVTRTNRFEIFNFIIDEMDQITSDLPTRSAILAEGKEIGRISSGAAMALKARAALYAGTIAKNFGGATANDYFAKSLAASEAVINSGEYELFSDYSKLFSYAAEYSNEIILSRTYTKDFLPTPFFMNNAPRELTGRATVDLSISKSLVNQYQMQVSGMDITNPNSGYTPNDPYLGRDPRLEATLFLPAYDNTSYCSIVKGKRWDVRPGLPANLKVADVISDQGGGTKTGFAIKKYINVTEDAGQGSNDGTNLILIRYADVLLMNAEARIELNQGLDLAVARINLVRERATMPKLENSGYTAADLSNQSKMREIVQQERTVELAVEGLRIYDIKRWKIAEKLIKGPVEGLTYIDYKTNKPVTFFWETRVRIFTPERDYLFPIPAAERLINPNLTQNPGY